MTTALSLLSPRMNNVPPRTTAVTSPASIARCSRPSTNSGRGRNLGVHVLLMFKTPGCEGRRKRSCVFERPPAAGDELVSSLMFNSLWRRWMPRRLSPQDSGKCVACPFLQMLCLEWGNSRRASLLNGWQKIKHLASLQSRVKLVAAQSDWKRDEQPYAKPRKNRVITIFVNFRM